MSPTRSAKGQCVRLPPCRWWGAGGGLFPQLRGWQDSLQKEAKREVLAERGPGSP